MLKARRTSQPTIEVLASRTREQFKRGRFRAIAIEKAKPPNAQGRQCVTAGTNLPKPADKDKAAKPETPALYSGGCAQTLPKASRTTRCHKYHRPNAYRKPHLAGNDNTQKGCCHPIASPVSLPDERYQAAVGPHGPENCRNAGGSARCWWGGVDVGYGHRRCCGGDRLTDGHFVCR